MDPVQIASELFASPTRAFAVRLWDGLDLPAGRDEGVAGRLVLRHPRALAAFLPPVSERRLAEAFIAGDLDLEGDAIAVLLAAARWSGPVLRAALAPALLRVAVPAALSAGQGGASAVAARLRGGIHSLGRDRDAVRHHYDVSDDFYRLFLDRELVYSCGYFPSGGEDLEQAQQAKLELVCRKLRLGPAQRLLDVGCGWGALVAWAVERHPVEAVGITLSDNQLAEARRRVSREIAQGRASVLAADYRTFRPVAPFHKVASIGMMEHVGRRRLGAYFAAVHRLMHPGGLFLNHAIADCTPGTTMLPWASQRGGGFIERYIFPDSDLVPVAQVVAAAERAGFEVRDLESLREHYAATLGRWLERLEARFAEAVGLVGPRRARAYRLYLASSAVGFRTGRISVFQLLLARRGPVGRLEDVPGCRGEWYAPWSGEAYRAPGRAARRA